MPKRRFGHLENPKHLTEVMLTPPAPCFTSLLAPPSPTAGRSPLALLSKAPAGSESKVRSVRAARGSLLHRAQPAAPPRPHPAAPCFLRGNFQPHPQSHARGQQLETQEISRDWPSPPPPRRRRIFLENTQQTHASPGAAAEGKKLCKASKQCKSKVGS